MFPIASYIQYIYISYISYQIYTILNFVSDNSVYHFNLFCISDVLSSWRKKIQKGTNCNSCYTKKAMICILIAQKKKWIVTFCLRKRKFDIVTFIYCIKELWIIHFVYAKLQIVTIPGPPPSPRKVTIRTFLYCNFLSFMYCYNALNDIVPFLIRYC